MKRYEESSAHPKIWDIRTPLRKTVITHIFPEAFPLPFSSVSILPWFFCCVFQGEYDHPIAILGAGMGGLMTSLDFLRRVGTDNWDNQAMTRQSDRFQHWFVTLPFVTFGKPRTTFLGDLLCQNVESMFFFFEEEAFLLLHYVFIALSPLTNGDVMSNICSSPVQAWSNQFRHSGASLGTWGAPRGTNPSLGGTLR